MYCFIYLLPYIANLTAGIINTALVMEAALGYNASPAFISAIAACYAFGMMITALILSKVKISEKTYSKIIYIEPFLQIIIALLIFAYLPLNFTLLYSFLYGIATTLFFVPFQAVLGNATKRLPIRISGGLYILSWTLGLASGPVITGFIFNINLKIGYIIVVIMSVVMFILYYASKHIDFEKSSKIKESLKTKDINIVSTSRYKVYIGWLTFFIGALLLNTLRFMFVDYGIRINLAKSHIGILVGVLTAFIGIGAIISAFKFFKLERKRIFSLVAILGAISLVLISYTRSFYIFLIIFIILGVVTGFAYYCGVYYSMSNYENAGSNVAINESLSGIAGLLGPFAVGFLASRFGYAYGFLFLTFLVLVFLFSAVFIMHRFKSRRV